MRPRAVGRRACWLQCRAAQKTCQNFQYMYAMNSVYNEGTCIDIHVHCIGKVYCVHVYSTRQKKFLLVPFYFIILFRFDPFRFMRIIILYACTVYYGTREILAQDSREDAVRALPPLVASLRYLPAASRSCQKSLHAESVYCS